MTAHILDIDQCGNPKSMYYAKLENHPAIKMTIREVMADPTIFTNALDISNYECLVWDSADEQGCDEANINLLQDFTHFDATFFVTYREALNIQDQIVEAEAEIVELRERIAVLRETRDEIIDLMRK